MGQIDLELTEKISPEQLRKIVEKKFGGTWWPSQKPGIPPEGEIRYGDGAIWVEPWNETEITIHYSSNLDALTVAKQLMALLPHKEPVNL